MTADKSKPWIWDQYWHGDRVALCFDAGQNQYGDDLSNDWRAWFAGFSDGACLLDLCTGNGALPLLAQDVADKAGKNFDLTGVDFANIDPARWLAKEAANAARIKFQGGIDVTALPFENGSFLGVSSQYGVEYSDLSRTLPEIARVLAAGGRGRLLCHAAEGTVASDARNEVARIDKFLASSKIFEATRRAIKAQCAISETPVPSPKMIQRARQTDAKLQQAMSDAAGHFNQTRDDFVRNTVTYLTSSFEMSKTHDANAALAARSQTLDKQVSAVQKAVLAHRERLKALADAAVNEARSKEIAAALRSLGLCVNPPAPATANASRQIGWVLSFTKDQ